MLVGFGLVMVLSASSIMALQDYGDMWYFTRRQAVWIALGLFVMGVLMNIPYVKFQKWFLLLTGISFLLLVLVLIPPIGIKVSGARSWLGIGGFRLQPAEFAKLALILYLATLISKKGEQFRDFKRGLAPAITVTGIFAAVIAAQPDFGTAAILTGIALCVIICGGANLKHLFFLSVPLLGGMAVYALTHSHVMQRLTSFLNPWADPYGAGFHLIQSYYAFGHGGVTGVGFGRSFQKYEYLPHPHNDFIFAIIAEELGFVGVCFVFFLYILLIWRIIVVCQRMREPFCTLFGIGVASLIGIQAFINIGGACGLIPISGVPLPLISYGGSSMLATLMGIGIVLSISREANRRAMANEKPAQMTGPATA
ncbi:MAG: cell division protein FtsW, partial [Bacillaceae bacterium G1]